MDKRTIHFLIAIFLFLTAYNLFFAPKKPPQHEAAQPQGPQELQQAPPTETTPEVPLLSPSAPGTTSPLSKPEELQEEAFDKISVTASLRGGYIKSASDLYYGDISLFENFLYLPAHRDLLFDLKREGNSLIFTNQKHGITKQFHIADYTVTLRLIQPSEPASQEVVIFYNSLATSGLGQRYQEIFYKQGEMLTRTSPARLKPTTLTDVSFAGGRSRYFAVSLLRESFHVKLSKKDDKTKGVVLSITPAQDQSEISIYLGPQLVSELEKVGLGEIVHYGFFHSIGTVILKALHLFNSFTHNWGLSIVLLSLVIYFVFFPFTAASTKAMKKMQNVQPHVEELKAKYKDNPQKLNKEIMQLYKDHRVNPLGGCLPLFFQIPIIWAFWSVVPRALEFKGASFLWIKDLSMPDRLVKLPFQAQLPVLGSLEYINLLPLLLIFFGVLQQKITAGSSQSSQQQKTMGLFFAVFIGVIFYNFPSCLVLYWFMQNLLTLIYQRRIMGAHSSTTPTAKFS